MNEISPSGMPVGFIEDECFLSLEVILPIWQYPLEVEMINVSWGKLLVVKTTEYTFPTVVNLYTLKVGFDILKVSDTKSNGTDSLYAFEA